MNMYKTVYIHYGDDAFHTPDPIVNRDHFTKPKGGLWASRKYDEEMTWKRWCEQENFWLDRLDRSFEFTLKDTARILVIDDEDQLDNLPKLDIYRKESDLSECHLDFETLKKQYDAIELTNIQDLYWRLYGWDCNSILIMNPDIVCVCPKEG